MMRRAVIAAALVVLGIVGAARAETRRTIAGSLQLDYLVVPTGSNRATTLDGLTAELSLKMSIDFTENASASVKVCFACHGFEAAAAFVDLRAADELTVRIGRLTPEFGSFPARGDPANHRTNDKPLPYDMGRMLHHANWNEGVLPSPWVDNGVELLGTRFVAGGRVDYAAYVLSGPKGPSDGADFDFVASRDPNRYYVDNNSVPVFGARLSGTADLDGEGHGVTFGASVMTGHYDPARALAFMIAGADLTLSLAPLTLRAEYLVRRTDMAVAPGGVDPRSRWRYAPGDDDYDDHYFKHGFYAEAEVPIGSVDAFARFDGLLRFGNVLADGAAGSTTETSALSSTAKVWRYTGGAAIRIGESLRLKASAEYYRFSDFGDEVALHVGVATAF